MIFSLEDVGQHCMIVTVKIHHALYDGVSLPLIMGRFAQLCQDDGVQRRTAGRWRTVPCLSRAGRP